MPEPDCVHRAVTGPTCIAALEPATVAVLPVITDGAMSRLLAALVAALVIEMRLRSLPLLLALSSLFALPACTPESDLAVVVSLRRSLAGPVLATFARETGAALDVKYIEPDQTVPDEFDVLWSDDPNAPIALAAAGRLARLPLSALHDRPVGMFDPDGHWIGITADVRVIAFDPQRVDAATVPTHFEELLDPRWAPQVILANPRARSGGWHAAALFASKGAQPTADFYRDLRRAGAVLADDERGVLDGINGDGPPIGVLDGEVAFAAREIGQTIGILIPDQDGNGAILRATTVALGVRAADSPRAAQLISYLLSAPVGRRLALMSSHLVLLESEVVPTGALALRDLKRALPTQIEIARQLSEVRRLLQDLR